MLRAILLLSFITVVFVGLYHYTNKMVLNIETDITKNIHDSLSNSGVLNREDTQVFIAANGRDITLRGVTTSTEIRTNISDIARSVSGVTSLSNEMNIASSITEKPNKGLTFSNIFSKEKEEKDTEEDSYTTQDNTTVNPPRVLNIIKCDPAVCAHAKPKETTKSTETESNLK